MTSSPATRPGGPWLPLVSDEDGDSPELNVLVAEVALREAQLLKMAIRAPFSGIVGLRSVSLGSYLPLIDRISGPGTATGRLVSRLVAGDLSSRTNALRPDYVFGEAQANAALEKPGTVTLP